MDALLDWIDSAANRETRGLDVDETIAVVQHRAAGANGIRGGIVGGLSRSFPDDAPLVKFLVQLRFVHCFGSFDMDRAQAVLGNLQTAKVPGRPSPELNKSCSQE